MVIGSLMLAVVLTATNTQVVVSRDAVPNAVFAAEELSSFLSQSLGAEIPIVREPKAGAANIFVGRSKWSDEQGLDPAAHPWDSYLMRATAENIYLLGMDDPGNGVSRQLKNGSYKYQHASLFAVYAFLEEFAGIRFYFPGELGTIVPRSQKIDVPALDRVVTPNFLVREWYCGNRAYWFGKDKNDADGIRMKALAWLRLRMGSRRIPLCHGSNRFCYLKRFGKTHPEYFSLKTNGSRHTDPNARFAGHLCWSSPVVDEIYEDVKAAISGEKPASRGIPLADWGVNVDSKNKIVDIMPQDGMPKCACKKCRAADERGESVVWLATAKIAQRLLDEGVGGSVAQMAYGDAKKPPVFALPTNIYIQVAVNGPWSTGRDGRIAREEKAVGDWCRKLGHKVWIWTYAAKHPSVGPNFDGIPQLSMHAWGSYYKRFSDKIFGCFAESETDRFSFNYLNYYVYSRVCWDAATDVDAVLDEHYRLMFGPAAAEMKSLYEIMERKWMDELTGESVDTPLGPTSVVPSKAKVFTEIYSPSVLEGLDGIVAAAREKTIPGSLERRRIDLIAQEFIGSIRREAEKFLSQRRGVMEYRADVGRDKPIALRELLSRSEVKPTTAPVKTEVSTWKSDGALHARFVCEEPHMDRLAEKERPRNHRETWADNCVEWQLAPDGDRGRVYQVVLTSKGSVYMASKKILGIKGVSTDLSWGLGVKTSVVREKDRWIGEIEIPLAEIGGKAVREIPSCFGRNRALDGVAGSAWYCWGPESLRGFGQGENFGTMVYDE